MTPLEAALAEVAAGAREVGGNNEGPWVEKYLNADHEGRVDRRDLPWCVGFYLWCWRQAGPLPVRFTLSSGTLWERMPRKERYEGIWPAWARPGDALFWNFGKDDKPTHVNMLHNVGQDGVVWTIGGNEGDEASGAPVKLKKRGDLRKLWGVGSFVAEAVGPLATSESG